MDHCTGALIKKFPNIPKEVIEEMVSQLEAVSGQSDFANAAKIIRQGNLDRLRMKGQGRMKDALANKDMQEFIGRDVWKGKANDAFLAKFQGVDFLANEGNRNFVQTRMSFRDRYLNMLDSGFDKETMAGVRDGKLDEQIADAMDSLNKGLNIQDLSPIVQKAAKTLKSINKNLIDDLRNSGVLIQERADYIARQSHDQEKIADAGFDDWYQDIYSRLNLQKTFWRYH